MSAFGLFSVKGAPGTTTLATQLAAHWHGDDAVLIEADPAGGDLALRLGIGQQPGLAQLAARLLGSACGRSVFDGPVRYVAREGFDLVTAPVEPAAARTALQALAEANSRLVDAARSRPVILDLGRLDGSEPAITLARCCGALAVLMRGDIASLGHVREADWITQLRPRVGFVLIDSGPYRAPEAADALGLDCLGVIPFGRRQPHTRRSARAIGALQANLAALAAEPQPSTDGQLAEVSTS